MVWLLNCLDQAFKDYLLKQKYLFLVFLEFWYILAILFLKGPKGPWVVDGMELSGGGVEGV